MFDLKKTVSLPFYNGTGYLYVHDRTGMEIFHIKNDSSELSCCFMFATPSEDSTGAAHILEHTVLCGSARFPVKDPFNLAVQSSPNTYMNAMTFPDKTLYPFASPLKKDFDILFEIYADAVFNPLLRKSSFEQEGIRFFGDSFDGVVFNEMSGVRASEDEIVQSAALSSLFDGTPYSYDSGGDPYCIADLTYEEYLKRYRKWYSPSNCRLFFFGDLDCAEYMEKLEKLYLGEENLKRWDNEKIIPNTDIYPLKQCGFIRDKRKCTTKDANTVVLSWLTTPSSDSVELMTANMVVDVLLGNPGAPLYKAVIDSDLGADLSNASGTAADYPYLPFTVGFSEAQKGKEDEIEDFLISTLRNIAEEGLPEDLVQGLLKRLEFSIREIPGSGMPYGLLTAIRVSRTWLRGGEVEETLDRTGILNAFKERLKQERYLENWILDNLVNNPNRCLLTVCEDSSYAEEFKALMDEKLKVRKSSFDPQELERQREVFEEFVNSEDSEESLLCIKRITVSDLPERVPLFDNEKLPDTPYPHLCSMYRIEKKTNGITYLHMGFDCSVLDEDEKYLLPLFLRLLLMCDTKEHSYTELGALIRKITGGFSVVNACETDSFGKSVSTVILSAKFLTEDTLSACRLTSEIFLDCILTDVQRIKAALTDILGDFNSNYLYYGHYYAALNVLSLLSASFRENEITSGTASFLYLSSLKNKDNDEFVRIADKLCIIKDKLFNRNKLTVQYCCEKSDTGQVHRALENLINAFMVRPPYKDGNTALQESKRALQSNPSYRIIKVSSGPSFNAMAFSLPQKDEVFCTRAGLLSSILSSGPLWETVRGKGGAYGVDCSVSLQDKNLSFSSYRDPGTDSTFKAFEEAFSYEVSPQEIENTVVTLIGKELKPMPPNAYASEAFRRILGSLKDSLYLERRKTVIGTTAEDLRSVARKLDEQCRKSSLKVSVRSSLPPEKDGRTEVVELPL